MDRQVRRLAQRLEQNRAAPRLQETGHVLQRDDVRAGFLQLIGQRDIVFEVVFRPGGIEDIAGIADRRFADLVFLRNRIHRDAHIVDPVEAVEDAEDVDAAPGRLADEVRDDIVRIVRVADAIGAAQKHLQQQVRRILAHQGQTLPRILGQEAHGDVEGRAAPAFEREELRQRAGIGSGDAGDVIGAHASREQRLVAVAHRRVGHQHPRSGHASSRRIFFGPSSSSICLVPAAMSPLHEGTTRRGRIRVRHRPAACFRDARSPSRRPR